jgi:hypothetical protein
MMCDRELWNGSNWTQCKKSAKFALDSRLVRNTVLVYCEKHSKDSDAIKYCGQRKPVSTLDKPISEGQNEN